MLLALRALSLAASTPGRQALHLINPTCTNSLSPSLSLLHYSCTTRLEDDHQKIWYDYLQLKLEDNRGLKNDKKIKRLLNEADEELDWVISILEQKGKRVICL